MEKRTPADSTGCGNARAHAPIHPSVWPARTRPPAHRSDARPSSGRDLRLASRGNEARCPPHVARRPARAGAAAHRSDTRPSSGPDLGLASCGNETRCPPDVARRPARAGAGLVRRRRNQLAGSASAFTRADYLGAALAGLEHLRDLRRSRRQPGLDRRNRSANPERPFRARLHRLPAVAAFLSQACRSGAAGNGASRTSGAPGRAAGPPGRRLRVALAHGASDPYFCDGAAGPNVTRMGMTWLVG